MVSKKIINIGEVKINCEYYSGEDLYSDGEIENDLLNIVKSSDSYDEILSKTYDFPIYYHLAKEREFITEAMNLSSNLSILELGSGCGAITGKLAEQGKTVTCIELSKQRSLINAYKNKKYSNIEIYVGNFQDIKLNKKFDIITLIGVFEYSNFYIDSKHPYEDLLIILKNEFLKSNGKIYIAIENRLGAKYLSGCIEDHASKENIGLEGYLGFLKARTFSYYEWLELLKRVSCNNYKFYYPYPDYKFPRYIFSDEFLPSSACNLEQASNYFIKKRQYFNDVSFLKSLVFDKEFKLFANSYLIELGW